MNILNSLNYIISTITLQSTTDNKLDPQLFELIRKTTLESINDNFSRHFGTENEQELDVICTQIEEINGEYKITIETKRFEKTLIRIKREIDVDLSEQLSKKCFLHVSRVDLDEDEVIYSVKEYFEQAQNNIDISYDEIFVTPIHIKDRIIKNRFVRISMENSTRHLSWLSLSVKEYLQEKFGKPFRVSITPMAISREEIDSFLKVRNSILQTESEIRNGQMKFLV